MLTALCILTVAAAGLAVMWWATRPRHTVDSVLREIVEGVEAGTVVIPGVDAGPSLTPAFMAAWRDADAQPQRAADAEADSHEREWLR